MINFKQYLAEARMAPLYHATTIGYFKSMMTTGIQARTYHHDHVVGKAPHVRGHDGRLMVKDADSSKMTYGISTTRRYKFSVSWIAKVLSDPGLVIEFDQQKLTHRYKLVPVNFYGWGRNFTRSNNDSHRTNEFEEFIVMKNKEVLPWSTVTKIHIPPSYEGGEIEAFAKQKGIKVVVDPLLPDY